MKKIDKLILSSSFGPFIVAFAIALFVLVMQFLWLYIDEIAGKGVSIFILVELISYLSVATFPMALPIAVLIASVMVMGNLSERYELSSMKSAGVSLFRVMRMMVLSAAAVALFSYVCSDYLIPIANLKFKARLYDIRKQKPALTIEQGIFNEDFRLFVIRVGEKEKDGETIKNVMIEDQTRAGSVRFNQILADSGQMYTTSDKRYFVMNLFKGTQYQEPSPQGAQTKQKFPFIRIQFDSWAKVWDLKEFEMNPTDEDRFRSQRSMLSMNQLRVVMDSLKLMMDQGRRQMVEDNLIAVNRKPEKPKPAPNLTRSDSLAMQTAREEVLKKRRLADIEKPTVKSPAFTAPYKQTLIKDLGSYNSFLLTFDSTDQDRLRKEAFTRMNSAENMLKTRETQIGSRSKEYVKTGYELFIKYSYALVCLVFLFIGAPMGAIIKKGGFGYPILVSIIFFVAFVMLSIVCKKLAELYILTPFWAAMTPCLLLVPIGVFLTLRAMNDEPMFNPDRLITSWQWIKQHLQKKQA